MITIKQINLFNDFDSFSYKTPGKVAAYSNPNKEKRFSKPYLAVDRKGEIVIIFQNRVTRFFGGFFHFILSKLHIRHTTTNSKDVWQALKKNKIITESFQYPTQNKQMRQIFTQIIRQQVRKAYQEANPVYDPSKDITMKQFQKYVYFLDESDTQNIQNLLNEVQDKNSYFDGDDHCLSTLDRCLLSRA